MRNLHLDHHVQGDPMRESGPQLEEAKFGFWQNLAPSRITCRSLIAMQEQWMEELPPSA
uniref:Uncharacterized protein n=1 Tax=Physcomitrium patens TaxID=3218 RepID=A0A2K1KE94_PHYPA|nr:hypothetical protein PHYPA_008478 [Physcomitrium patens]